ncbi:MAG: BatD family protein [bacterium]
MKSQKPEARSQKPEGRGQRAKRLFAACLLLLVTTVFHAPKADAQLTLSASVNTKTVGLNDSLNLSVSISGAGEDMSDPQLPSLPNFNVYSSGRSQNISIINGKISSSITYSFTLTPRFVGKAVIGPVVMVYKGRRYETAPMEITVIRPSQSGQPPTPGIRQPQAGAASPAQGQRKRHDASVADVFVTAETDKKKAYVNEQVTLTVRFHNAGSLLGNPEYVAPAARGFISEDLPPMRNGEMIRDGRRYYYTEIKTALFGAQPGEGVIDRALVRCQVRDNPDIDPFAPDFFQRFFSHGMAGGRTQELRTEPLRVRIEPLPEKGRPTSFSGAVGQFKIKASADRKELKAGEALTLSVTVQGTGNLKTITAPALPDMPSFRVYDTVSSLNLQKSNDLVQGSKAYKTVFIPKVQGVQVIPSIRFSFFNPVSGSYEEVSSRPLEINVLAGAAPGPVQAGRPGAAGRDITQFADDIHYVKDKTSLSAFTRFMLRINALGWFNLAPLAAFLLSLAWNGLRKLRNKDPAAARCRRALSRAHTSLKKAERLFDAGKAPEAVALISCVLTDYLSDKLNLPVAGLTLRKTLFCLRDNFPAVSARVIEELESIWRELELMRFAPGGSRATPTAERNENPVSVRVEKLLQSLEKELRK